MPILPVYLKRHFPERDGSLRIRWALFYSTTFAPHPVYSCISEIRSTAHCTRSTGICYGLPAYGGCTYMLPDRDPSSIVLHVCTPSNQHAPVQGGNRQGRRSKDQGPKERTVGVGAYGVMYTRQLYTCRYICLRCRRANPPLRPAYCVHATTV